MFVRPIHAFRLVGWAVFFSGAVLAAGAVLSGTAHACTCGQPAIVVTPRPGQIAPRNTHVWVEVPTTLAEASVTLRGGGPVDLRRYGGGEERIIEVIPRAPLAAHGRFDVLIGTEVVGVVMTGDVVDEAPPRWDGLVTGEVSIVPAAGCGTGEPVVVFGLGKRSDDATPTAALRFGIWVGDAGKPFDYAKPPTTVVSATGDKLILGHESRCLPSNLELPATLAVGIRVIDLAGNAGDPSEADITVRRDQGLGK